MTNIWPEPSKTTRTIDHLFFLYVAVEMVFFLLNGCIVKFAFQRSVTIVIWIKIVLTDFMI